MTDQYQLFESLRAEEYDALSADIAKRGVLVPVEFDEEGNVLDGHHRLMIADSLGIDCPRVVRSFDSEQDKIEHVLKLNLLRRHLGPVSWANAFEKLLEVRGVQRGQGSNQGHSATVAECAEELGVPERTARHRLSTATQLRERPDLAEQVDSGDLPVRTALQMVSGAHVGNNSGDNEWYTPAAYINAAVSVMGAVDLDPASTFEANEIVGALTFYSESDDGLTKDWKGRVWMNPPYARPLIDNFCGKLAESFSSGDVTEACVLVNNATETGWFHALAEVAGAICFPRNRVKFWHPRKESTPLQGQAVIYLGPNVSGFREEFLRFGFTVEL